MAIGFRYQPELIEGSPRQAVENLHCKVIFHFFICSLTPGLATGNTLAVQFSRQPSITAAGFFIQIGLPMNQPLNPTETFSSRWAMLATALGIAIGTGNIWRFPRVAAANGGGAFILLWMVFLFLWSIPLLTTESAIGRHFRKGTLGSFSAMLGRFGPALGGFVTLVTAGIMCYYCVVSGWCIKYFVGSLSGQVNGSTGPEYWSAFSGSMEAGLYHVIAALITGAVVLSGIRAGIERTARIFIPVLAVILLYSAIRACLLPGSGTGLTYLFHFNLKDLAQPGIYLEALSQSAWSTGAGWGLLLTYSVYSRQKEPVVGNSLIMGLGNNGASILAAIAVVPTVFSVLPYAQAIEVATSSGENSTGLTFIWIPRLLGSSGGGWFLLTTFFLALSIAALSSLISMFEFFVRNLIDLGLTRIRATAFTTLGVALLGLPSSLSSAFFDNQDWVWGLGLLVNGMLFSVAVRSYGTSRFRNKVVNIDPGADMRLGSWFEPVINWLLPVQFVVLLFWWFYRSVSWNESGWWNPLETFSIGSVLAQWLCALIISIALSGFVSRRLKSRS